MGRLVIACYRPKPGQQDALRELVRRHVRRLRALGLATDRAPVAMEAEDGTCIEVFEWVSEEAIQNAHNHPAVLQMWDEFGKVCDYVPVAQIGEASDLFSSFTPLESE
jgi:hypothetical protein